MKNTYQKKRLRKNPYQKKGYEKILTKKKVAKKSLSNGDWVLYDGGVGGVLKTLAQ